MKKVFDKLKFTVRELFGKTYKWLRLNSELSVKVTSQLKKLVESPMADVITDLIPGEFDNGVKIILRKFIPQVAFKVAVFHNIMQESDSPKDAVDRIITYLQTLPVQGRASFWIRFSAELNIALSDGHISLDEAVILTQLAYKELYA